MTSTTDGAASARAVAWVEWLLIDGPAAGQRVRVHPDVGFYTYQYYEYGPVALETFVVDPTAFHHEPSIANYRIGFAHDLDRRVIRIGWCSGEPQPDPEQLANCIRQEPPVKVVAGAEAWTFYCDFAIRQDHANSTIQGTCQCGWRTETVPRRRAKEVLSLVDAHMELSLAALLSRMRARPMRQAPDPTDQGA